MVSNDNLYSVNFVYFNLAYLAISLTIFIYTIFREKKRATNRKIYFEIDIKSFLVKIMVIFIVFLIYKNYASN